MNKNRHLIGGVVILLLIAGGGFFMMQGRGQQQVHDGDSVFEMPDEVIPTVDSSVSVSIKGATDAVIMVKGIPADTEVIEYELSYNTASGSIEGIFGMIEVDGASEAEEEVTFGTCSSGVCRYHKIEGPVHGVFKFSGSYGDRLLEKDFEL